MTTVVFGTYSFKYEQREGVRYIFDPVRKKYVPLTPEEWVRQHVLQYLLNEKQYSPALIAVERGIELNGLAKRFDVVVFDNTGAPRLLVECKAPEELLNEKVFTQIANYNQTLRVDYLWVTNGTHNFCCSLKEGIQLLPAVPSRKEMMGG